MSEIKKTNVDNNVSFEDISDRLAKIESQLSQNKTRKPFYQSLSSFVKRVVTKENIEFVFSLSALIISITVAVIILNQ
tara:strand:+ start:409 stop:642 length:234 start_codon:yes stop_codon:yes gene_type:complete